MIIYKHGSLAAEYDQLKVKNPALAALLSDLSDYVGAEFGKDVVVTMIFRTQAQQEAIYGKGTKRKSPHMFWHAIDIRDWIYSADEKKEIIAWLKSGYDSTNHSNYIPQAGSRTVWLHQVGTNGMHFHIQYHGPTVYNFSEGMTITA